MGRKEVKLRAETRFILCINEDFDTVSLRDLRDTDKLSVEECASVIEDNFIHVKTFVESLEDKDNLRQKAKELMERRKNLTIVK